MFPSKRNERLTMAVAALAMVATVAVTGCASAGNGSSAGGSNSAGQSGSASGGSAGSSSGTSASGSTASSSGSAQGGTLTYAANFGPVSLNPVLQGVGPVGNPYINVAYDSITHIDGSGKVTPDLATSWKYTDDTNTTFQLTLRQGVKFSDGTTMTANDVVASLKYALQKGVNGPNWLGSVTGITAPDEHTVQIKTSQPNTSLAKVLSQRLLLGSVISPAGLKDPSALKNATFGAGPYVLDTKATVAGDQYVYTPNKYYWDPSKIHWKKVVIKVAGNTTSALQAVENGEADFMSGDATTGQAADAAGLGLAIAPFGLSGVNIMDRDGTIVPALKNVKVRQALLYAVDRKSLSQAVFPGYSQPGFSLFIKGFPGYSDDINQAYPYDLKKAQQLMKEAGYADGFSVNVSTATSDNTNVLAQGIIQSWSKIGVKAHLTTYTDLGQWTTDILAGKYPITFYNYGALPNYVEAQSFFTGGKTQFNAFNTKDDKLATMLNDAESASSPDKAEAAFKKVLHYAQVDQAWVGVTYDRDAVFIYDKKTVTGFAVSSLNPIPDIWNIKPES